MRNFLLKLFVKIQSLAEDEGGQDLVEYLVVVSLIALAATVSMKALATTIGTAFASVGTKLTTYTS